MGREWWRTHEDAAPVAPDVADEAPEAAEEPEAAGEVAEALAEVALLASVTPYKNATAHSLAANPKYIDPRKMTYDRLADTLRVRLGSSQVIA